MKIAIGSDHVGLELKNSIIDYLRQLEHEVTDFGPTTNERTHYPIYSKIVSDNIVSGQYERGILICGTGVGISIAANKIHGIRAVVCSEPYSAKASREHNNTNVLAFGSRVVGVELAKLIVKEWLVTEYEGGRHEKRIDMITTLERK